MKAFNRAIDKFCLKHRGFGIPRLMMYIVIGTAIVFIIGMMDTTGTFYAQLAFSPEHIFKYGQVWRIISWVFCPFDNSLLNTALMLYFYYFIGSTLERVWGTPKFTIYYLMGILLNIVYGTVVWFLFERFVFLVPSYLNLSMFFAFAILFPDQVIMLFFIIPVKIKWLALVNAGVFAFSIVRDVVNMSYVTALFPVVALLNLFIFCGGDLIRYLRPVKARTSKQAIDFKKAAKQVQRTEAGKQYRHKCAVCGRTDAENPGLEFRYCSRCEGYHCFCADHINNHVHFQE